MARARLLKPEFFASEQIARAGEPAAMLFVGLLIEADDSGVVPANCFAISRRTIGLWGADAGKVRKRVDALIANDLLVEYDVDGVRYWRITGFSKHQKLHRPSYRFPLENGIVPENTTEFQKRPPNAHRTPTERPVGARSEAEAEAEDRREETTRTQFLDPDTSQETRRVKDRVCVEESGNGKQEPAHARDPRGHWEAAMRGMGLDLAWKAQPAAEVLAIRSESTTETEAVARFYAGQCRDASPSPQRFATDFETWRARSKATKPRKPTTAEVILSL